MDFSFIVGISAFVGPILSFFYEKFFGGWKWSGKFWVFSFLCILFGGLLAFANREITFNPLHWDTIELIFVSLGSILKWAGMFLIAGETYFFKVIKKQ